MSLILDALKKSEQERRRDQGPDLQTIHQPIAARPPVRSRTALWVCALVLANVGMLIGWWWQQRSSQAPAAAVAVPAAAGGAAATPVTAAASPAPADGAPQAAAPTAAEPAQGAEFTHFAPAKAAPAVAARAPGSRLPIREFTELPESARNELPAMTFSFHVYSADPQKRTIIINNRRLREGDEVGSGLTLEEITEDGVVLAGARQRVHIGVLSGW